MHAVVDGPVGDEILGAMEKEGMIGLAFYDNGMRSIYTVNKPIRTLADVNGLKIRVQQSDLFVAVMQALGANPTPLPSGEVYTALTTGLIDAAENNIPTYDSLRHFEAAGYFNLTQHSMSPEVLVFSKIIWDRLPEEDQAMIRQAAKDSVPHMRKLWEEREVKARQTVEAGGAKIGAIEDKQAFVNAVQPVYAKFAGTPELKSLVDRIQATQ
jgi:tripartite ATP-independent transporter DctP family solute receptor